MILHYQTELNSYQEQTYFVEYEEGIYVGRTYRDAPEVDGYIFIHAEEEIISGDFVTVKVTGADEYDLTGDVIYEFTE